MSAGARYLWVLLGTATVLLGLGDGDPCDPFDPMGFGFFFDAPLALRLVASVVPMVLEG